MIQLMTRHIFYLWSHQQIISYGPYNTHTQSLHYTIDRVTHFDIQNAVISAGAVLSFLVKEV